MTPAQHRRGSSSGLSGRTLHDRGGDQGYEVLHGPAGEPRSVDLRGLLDPPEEGLSFELSGGGTLTGVGSCAGM
ncbi:MAG: hypothetical protein R2789_13050 [Microthrixaceae bacterium]